MICTGCQRNLSTHGAVLLSPPLLGAQQVRNLCQACFEKVENLLVNLRRKQKPYVESLSVDELNIGLRACHALAEHEIWTIAELTKMSEASAKRKFHFKVFQDLRNGLKEKGLSFSQEGKKK